MNKNIQYVQNPIEFIPFSARYYDQICSLKQHSAPLKTKYYNKSKYAEHLIPGLTPFILSEIYQSYEVILFLLLWR
jgi:hypothetical protein